MNRRSIGPFFWGAILVTIGGLLLARNFGYDVPFWNALAVYWPVLIIAWGLVKLIDYFRFRNLESPPRLFSGGEVALLLFVIFAGSAITVGANISPTVGEFFGIGELIDLWSITGNNYEYTEHLEADVAQGSVIDIFNLYGNVEVRPSAGDKVILDVRKTVRAASKEEADRLAGEFTFSIRPDADGRIVIRSNRDENADIEQERPGNDRQRFKSTLILQVPVSASLHLTNRFGGTRIAEINGDHELRNSFGSVNVRAVTGKVNVDNRFGSVDVADNTGDVTISTTFASANARNIQGAVTIKGNQNEIGVTDISGPLTIETSFNDLNVRNPGSTVNINGRYGDIEVSLSEPPGGDIRIDSQFSDVTLRLPASAAFTFEIHTRFGDINSDFDATDTSEGGPEERQSGNVGAGGPRITIDTRNGDVNLERRG